MTYDSNNPALAESLTTKFKAESVHFLPILLILFSRKGMAIF